MNKSRIKELLESWELAINKGENQSKKAASKMSKGSSDRIGRVVGKPVIFDAGSYSVQRGIQKELCNEMPEWSYVINSDPEIMDGYAWKREDFIELYFNHFRVVVEKLRKIIGDK